MKKITYINCTPHPINVAGTIYPVSENTARVSVKFSPIIDGECNEFCNDIEGIPLPKTDTKFIVSNIVYNASARTDIVCPATGHPETIRDEKGFIVSVPAFKVKH